MNKLFLIAVVMVFVACNQAEKQPEAAAASSSVPSDMAGYSVNYSNDFSIGDPAHSTTILQLWKHWDNGDLLSGRSLFADSLTVYGGDGNLSSGPTDSILAGANQFRNSFTEMRSVVDAIIPLKSNDKDENWVTIWGTEYHTKDGVADSLRLQETWRFNKEGKVDLMFQYQRPGLMKTN